MMRFLRHGSGVQWENNMAPDDVSAQGPDAPLAHRRPGYSSPSCTPAEPDSASPGNTWGNVRSLIRTWAVSSALAPALYKNRSTA